MPQSALDKYRTSSALDKYRQEPPPPSASTLVRDFAAGFGGQALDIGIGLLRAPVDVPRALFAGAQAIPDITRNILSGGETRRATFSGFKKGAKEGSEQALRASTIGEPDATAATKAGRLTANLASIYLPAKGASFLKSLIAARPAPPVVLGPGSPGTWRPTPKATRPNIADVVKEGGARPWRKIAAEIDKSLSKRPLVVPKQPTAPAIPAHISQTSYPVTLSRPIQGHTSMVPVGPAARAAPAAAAPAVAPATIAAPLSSKVRPQPTIQTTPAQAAAPAAAAPTTRPLAELVKEWSQPISEGGRGMEAQAIGEALRTHPELAGQTRSQRIATVRNIRQGPAGMFNDLAMTSVQPYIDAVLALPEAERVAAAQAMINSAGANQALRNYYRQVFRSGGLPVDGEGLGILRSLSERLKGETGMVRLPQLQPRSGMPSHLSRDMVRNIEAQRAKWHGQPPPPSPAGSTSSRLFDAFQTIRAESALSGLAIPKNIATAVGAAPIAAAEGGVGLKPLQTMFLQPIKNARAFARGFHDPIDIGAAAGQRLKGPISRTISGIDNVAIEALKRAGVPASRIDELLLREPISNWLTPKTRAVLESPVGRSMVMFQRTPVNQFFGGLEEMRNLLGRTGAPSRQKLVTAGLMAGGAAAGGASDNPYVQALSLPMAYALGGRRGLPMAVSAAGGAYLRSGPGAAGRAVAGSAPFQEYGFSPHRLVPGYPAFFAAKKRVEEAIRGRRSLDRYR